VNRLLRVLIALCGASLLLFAAIIHIGNERLLTSPDPLHEDAALIVRLDRLAPWPIERRFIIARALTSPYICEADERDRLVDRLAQLHEDPERWALEARLAVRCDTPQRALRAALRAGDLTLAAPLIEHLRRAGAPREAADAVDRLIVVLHRRGIDRDTLTAAYLTLGELHNELARRAVGAARIRERRAALSAFHAAIDLAPLSGRGRLDGGYAALLLGNLAEAESDFAATIALDPRSASGNVGLARVALARNRRALALRYLAIAQREAPLQHDVVELAGDLRR